ncbi:MAG: hypothetical protein JNJ82_15380 [Opitutaceae bacterium]|nr:hypothetical protein [Opitutaceae bacterium]
MNPNIVTFPPPVSASHPGEGPNKEPETLRVRAAIRRFDLARPPPEPTPRFFINGHAVCTPGNITNLIAQAKAGKSAYVSAMLAAAIVAASESRDRDCLGVSAAVPSDKNIILHIDTEQAPRDHFDLMRRTLRRAGVEEAPSWLNSYGLAGFSAEELRRLLHILLEDNAASGRTVFAVIIDGTADMVLDVNDPAECNPFVAELQGLAIQYETAIVNVVHENPGPNSTSGGKMRGHLGSQLERKAESNIRLKKTEEITVVFSEKMRRAPILESEGPRFKWDDESSMHRSCESAGVMKDAKKRERARDLAVGVFEAAGKERMRHGELLDAIAKLRRIEKSTAEDRFTEWKRLGVIVKNSISGDWTLANPVTP